MTSRAGDRRKFGQHEQGVLGDSIYALGRAGVEDKETTLTMMPRAKRRGRPPRRVSRAMITGSCFAFFETDLLDVFDKAVPSSVCCIYGAGGGAIFPARSVPARDAHAGRLFGAQFAEALQQKGLYFILSILVTPRFVHPWGKRQTGLCVIFCHKRINNLIKTQCLTID